MAKRGQYSQELKQEAINMVVLQGMVQEQVERLLSIPSGTLANGVIRSKDRTAPQGKPGEVSLAGLAAENARLRKELEQATMERDILKKATAYFAKDAVQGTRS